MDERQNLLDQGVLLELAATALQALMLPFGVKPRPVAAAGPGRTRPVVLIHGYGSNRSCFLPLEVYLRAIGFDRVFPFTYKTPADIGDLTRALGAFIQDVKASCRSGRQTVDLIAYSLGGLIARTYLQEHGGAREVDQCITLATPHLGTYSSYWAPTDIGKAMRPESEFIEDLNDPSKRAPGVRYLSLWAERDLMVLPRENAIYEEGDDQRIDGVGHMGILVHPAALRQIAERLRAGQDIPASRIERVSLFARGILGRTLGWMRRKDEAPS